MTITKDEAREIASLFNAMSVADRMERYADRAGDVESCAAWLEAKLESATKLVEMGIPVVSYYQLRAQVAAASTSAVAA